MNNNKMTDKKTVTRPFKENTRDNYKAEDCQSRKAII